MTVNAWWLLPVAWAAVGLAGWFRDFYHVHPDSDYEPTTWYRWPMDLLAFCLFGPLYHLTDDPITVTLRWLERDARQRLADAKADADRCYADVLRLEKEIAAAKAKLAPLALTKMQAGTPLTSTADGKFVGLLMTDTVVPTPRPAGWFGARQCPCGATLRVGASHCHQCGKPATA